MFYVLSTKILQGAEIASETVLWLGDSRLIYLQRVFENSFLKLNTFTDIFQGFWSQLLVTFQIKSPHYNGGGGVGKGGRGAGGGEVVAETILGLPQKATISNPFFVDFLVNSNVVVCQQLLKFEIWNLSNFVTCKKIRY